jgi:peptide/nickel transport system substrate-binding protein
MVKRTRVVVGLIMAAALLATASCGGGAGDGSPGNKGGSIKVLRVGSTPASTLNYNKSNLGYRGLGNLVLEPLLVLDRRGTPQPWLAKSWQRTTPTTYVYHLRQGVKFSDGKELTAEDVAFALNFYRQPGSANASNFPTTLKSISATGKYTVQVTLSEPNVAWAVVPARAQLGIFQKSFYEKNKASFGQPGTGVVGTGPWKLDQFDPTSGAKLTAHSSYWGGSVPIQSITWTFFSSETSAATAFRAKQLDVFFPSENRAFASTAGTDLIAAPNVGDYGQFVMNVLTPPWNDVHVRRAVAYALDKQALIQAWGGYAEPTDYFIPSELLTNLGSKAQVDQALAGVPKYPHDLAKAKAEMAQSAYPNGVDVTIGLPNLGSAFRNVPQAIVPQLAKIGIRAKFKEASQEAFIGIVLGSDRKAIPALFTTVGAVSPDPGGAFGFAIGSANASAGNWNVSNWSTGKVDKLISDGFATSDPAKRLGIYAEMNKEFATNVPFVPLFRPQATLALSSQYAWPSFDGFWRYGKPWALHVRNAK